MRDLPENDQTTIIYVAGVGCTIIAVTLAITAIWLFAALVVLGVLIGLYYQYQPFSELSRIRRLHPKASNVIDQAEQLLAEDRANRERRMTSISAELIFLVDRLRMGRDSLMQIEKMSAENPFKKETSFEDGYKKMIDFTIAETVKNFLEMSKDEVKQYLLNDTDKKDDKVDLWQQ